MRVPSWISVGSGALLLMLSFGPVLSGRTQAVPPNEPQSCSAWTKCPGEAGTLLDIAFALGWQPTTEWLLLLLHEAEWDTATSFGWLVAAGFLIATALPAAKLYLGRPLPRWLGWLQLLAAGGHGLALSLVFTLTQHQMRFSGYQEWNYQYRLDLSWIALLMLVASGGMVAAAASGVLDRQINRQIKRSAPASRPVGADGSPR